MPRTRSSLLSLLAIVLLGLFAYATSFDGAWLLDDHPTIERNASIRSLHSWAMLAPPPTVGTAGRPFANLTFALNYAVGGTRVIGYHAVNIALHLAAALLLAGVIRRTLELPGQAARWATHSHGVALAAALLWVAHPLTTATVTYVSQRTEALADAGIVAVLYALLRYVASGRRRWLLAGWATAAIAMASKETAVTIPIVAYAFDAWFIAGSWQQPWRQRRSWYLGLGAAWILLAVLLSLAHLGVRGVGLDQGVSPWRYAGIECSALLTYARLSLWPAPLVFDYGWITAPSPLAVILVAALVLVVAIGIARGCRAAWLAALWLLLLAPTSTLVPIAEQPIAENRAYLPLAIVCTAIVLGAYRWLGRRSLPLLTAAAVALGVITLQRNRLYASEATLWRDVVAKRPANARAFNVLGLLAYQTGDLDRAIALHARAVELRPSYAEAEGNLGADLLRAHRPADAIPHFRRAAAVQPGLPGISSNLGSALLEAGDVAGAIDALRLATRQLPGDPEPHLALARAYATGGSLADARAEFAIAQRLGPGSPDAQLDLGNRLLRAGDVPGALAAYRGALRANPDYAAAHNNLAAALVQAGDWAGALQEAKAALRLQPNYPAAHGTAATALLQLGDAAGACDHFRAALALDPRSAPSHTGLGFALSRLGRTAEAAQEFRTALQINPNYAPARRALTELNGMRDDQPAAR